MRITANDIRKMEAMTNDETVAYLRRKMQPNILQRLLRCISVAAAVLCIAGTASAAPQHRVLLIPPVKVMAPGGHSGGLQVQPAPVAKMETPAPIPRPISVPRHHIPFHK